MAELRLQLQREHAHVLALEEQRTRHRAREGRLGRFADAAMQHHPGAPPAPRSLSTPWAPMWRPELEELAGTLQ
jgi:hypothetical protein